MLSGRIARSPNPYGWPSGRSGDRKSPCGLPNRSSTVPAGSSTTTRAPAAPWFGGHAIGPFTVPSVVWWRMNSSNVPCGPYGW
jgi:hypothetical protein